VTVRPTDPSRPAAPVTNIDLSSTMPLPPRARQPPEHI